MAADRTVARARGAATGTLRIRLLGDPRVEVDGRPLQVDTRKAVAMLAVLAVEGRRSREQLAALLWPESDEQHARGALRRTLSVLSGGLGGDWVVADRQSVDIAPGADIDIRRADTLEEQLATEATAGESAARRRLLDDLVGLHRGTFLDGFSLRNAADFDVWRTEEAERCRRQFVRALKDRAELEVAAGDLDDALATLRRWRDEEPLNEQVHHRLIQLLGQRGDRLGAVRVYRECVAVLERELGVAPLDTTTRVYQQVLNGETSDTPAATSTSGSGPRSGAMRTRSPATVAARPQSAHRLAEDLPLVGRDAELERVLDHLDRPGAVALVEGEAGIGKTRFIEELEARLHRRGIAVLASRCHRGEAHLPLGPILELVRDLLRRNGGRAQLDELEDWQRAELGRLLPELSTSDTGPSSHGRDEDRVRFLDALATAIDHLAAPAGRPAVLLLEDVHLADSGTRDLLAYLVHRLDRWRLRVVATRRDVEPDRHDAWLGDRVLHVALARLSHVDVARLCGFALGDGARDLGDRLSREADGLPLAVVQYLGWFAEEEPGPDDPWPLPKGLRDAVAERLADLGETATQIAGAIAVIGHGVDLPLLVDVSGRSEDETVTAIDELLDRRVAVTSRNGTFELAHDWLRTVAYDACSPARRRLLHSRVVTALTAREARHGGGRLAARIAEHARYAGLREEAATWSLRAGEHALSVFANEEALQHFETALALEPAAAAEVHARIARVHVLAGDYEAALTAYETAAAMAHDEYELTVVEHELGALHVRRREWAAARLHFEAALAGSQAADTGRAARIRADIGLTALHRGDLAGAEAQARTALRDAEEVEDREAVAQARNLAGMIARRQGAWEDAQRHLEHAAALAAHLRDPSAYIAALNNLALTTAEAGDVERARSLLTTALARCERQGDRHRQAALLNNLADLHHRTGDDAAAHEHLVRAVELFGGIGGEAADRTPDPEVWKLVEW